MNESTQSLGVATNRLKPREGGPTSVAGLGPDHSQRGFVRGRLLWVWVLVVIAVFLGWRLYVYWNTAEVPIAVYPIDSIIEAKKGGKISNGQLFFNIERDPVWLQVWDPARSDPVEVKVDGYKSYFRNGWGIRTFRGPGVATRNANGLAVWRFPSSDVWGFVATGREGGDLEWVDAAESKTIRAYGRDLVVRADPGVALLFETERGVGEVLERGWTSLRTGPPGWTASPEGKARATIQIRRALPAFTLRIEGPSDSTDEPARFVEISGEQTAQDLAIRVSCLFRNAP